MLGYMLDTNICIYALKRPPAVMTEKFSQHRAELCISSVVAGELFYGAERSEQRSHNMERIEHLMSLVEVLEFGVDAAAHFANIRAVLAQQGSMIGAYDLMIAGHARSLGLVLVTNNVREFERVQGLRIENWAASAR
jgi:tRNA(fMet)-specific endonuclease VapC